METTDEKIKLPPYTRLLYTIQLEGNAMNDANISEQLDQMLQALSEEDSKLEVRQIIRNMEKQNDGKLDEKELSSGK